MGKDEPVTPVFPNSDFWYETAKRVLCIERLFSITGS